MERSTTLTSRLPVTSRRCAEVAAYARGESLSAFARRAVERETRETLLAAPSAQPEDEEDDHPESGDSR